MGAKQRAIRLRLNRTFEEKDFSVDRNKVKVGKRDVVEFEPACVFSESKPRWQFWRGARHLILFVDGAKKALRFLEVTDAMMPFWTKGEAGEFVDKEIAKSLAKHKPMTWAQFIIILIPVLAVLAVVLKIALYFGVF